MIAVLDYDAGNIKSVEKALHFLGEEVKITRDREEILSADGVILPQFRLPGRSLPIRYSMPLLHA